MKDTYLLKSEGARRLYLEGARQLPIIDYHNHLSAVDIREDHRFADMTELWLMSDPYKHRLMRICGVEERYITGDAEPRDKFRRFCQIFPLLAGNPVYDWARMELADIFGVEELPTGDNADILFDRLSEMLASPEFSHNGILGRFGVEYQSPVAALMDDLSAFDGVSVAPSLRGDDLLSPSAELKTALAARTGIAVVDDDSYVRAVSVMFDRFHEAGCRFADHALDDGFFESDTDGKRAAMLVRLAGEYAARGWTLLLHMDAKRRRQSRIASVAGPVGGYAAVGGDFSPSALCDLLDRMDLEGGLPDTLLFPLNMSDQVALSVLQGSFSRDGRASRVGLGASWWWCDHAMGIRNTLSAVASFGVLSQFVGMTTDSRSVTSFVRHDYFRRLLCSWLDEQNRMGDWELPFEAQKDIVERICYGNALDKIKGNITLDS